MLIMKKYQKKQKKRMQPLFRGVFTSLFLLLAIGISAQNITVSGSVRDETGELLIGVSIMIKGTTTGTITDIDGRYSIVAPQNSVLNFSFIGCQNQEVVVIRENINVVMVSESNYMDEVVVIGYSSQKKAELSSAVVTIKGTDLTDVATSDIRTMLQGKVAGVMISQGSGQPGNTAEMRIRGTGSITAEARPLFVVDGIPGGSFNPNDVETLTVLKDAGATAVYGASGAGGVVVITTKHAKDNQPTRINFKASYGQKNVLQGKFEMMNGAELYDTHKEIYSASLFALQRPAELRDMNFDWLGSAFSTGNLQNYYVSATGSSGKINYMASIDYYQEDGTLINTNYEKLSTRLNLNAKLSETVDMNVRFNYSNSNNNESYSYIVLEGAYRTIPWDNPYDDEGNLVFINGDTRPDNGKKWYTQDRRNFLHGAQYNYARSKNEDLYLDVQLNWSIFDWLSFSTTNRYSSGGYNYKRFLDPRTFDPTYKDGYNINNIGQWGGFGSTNLLKASRSFNGHSINGLLGFEGGKSSNDYLSASGIGMPNGVEGLDAAVMQGVGGYFYEVSSYSYFAQFQYNYLSKYFLTASFRSDTSSRFSRNYPTAYFPGASASWLISNEDFLKGNQLISMLKLRASYGVTGNSAIDTFQSMAMYRLNTSYQNSVGAILSRESNPNLTWESAHMTGAGVDVSFIDRVHVNLDIYNIENKDLLLNVPRAISTGFEFGLENIGAVRNRGFEVQISSDNMRTKDFLWNTTFNIGANKNTVVSLPDGNPVRFSAGSTNIFQQVEVGGDMNSWYFPKWAGVDPENGNPQWEKLVDDGNGNITTQLTSVYSEATSQIVGKATPKFNGGITNTVSYKGFSLYLAGNFVYGNDIYHRDRDTYDADGAYLGYNFMRLQDGWSRWEQPGDNVTHPKLVMNGNNNSNNTSSRYLEDGSFFRLKNVTFSYNLKQDWLSAIKLQSCRVYISADNLFTLTKFSGLDPEVSLQNSDWSLAGMVSFNYPISRQFLIGFDILF